MTKIAEDAPVAPRRARWGILSLLLACMIVVGGILVWQMTAHSESLGGGSANPDTSPPAAGSSSPLTPPVPLTAMYDEVVTDQVAQGLHLTVAQVTAQLQAQPTPDLRSVGKQQNLAQDQLYRLVLSALQTADDRMVSSRVWTKPQADEEMQYWSQQPQVSLINGVARWFLQH
jgi:hypothetical protein